MCLCKANAQLFGTLIDHLMSFTFKFGRRIIVEIVPVNQRFVNILYESITSVGLCLKVAWLTFETV